MLEDLSNLLTGIYDPKSEANIAGVKDVEGEKKLNALVKTVHAMHGKGFNPRRFGQGPDDINILDIIGELK